MSNVVNFPQHIQTLQAARAAERALAKKAEHNHGPNFGRRVDGCPRCAELSAGAPARKGWGQSRAERDAQAVREIRAHDCKKSHCGPVCTFGEW